MVIPVDEPSGGVPADKRKEEINIIGQYINVSNKNLHRIGTGKAMTYQFFRTTVSNCFVKHKTMEIDAVVRYRKLCLVLNAQGKKCLSWKIRIL